MDENFFIQFWEINRSLRASFLICRVVGEGSVVPWGLFQLGILNSMLLMFPTAFLDPSPHLLHKDTWSFSSEVFPWTSQGSADMTVLSLTMIPTREKIDGSLQMRFTVREKPSKFSISQSSFPEDTCHSPP